jgi:hypothetical protein
MCHFIRCGNHIHNSIPNVDLSRIITTFNNGVCDNDMLGDIGVYEPKTVVELFRLIDRLAHRTEA